MEKLSNTQFIGLMTPTPALLVTSVTPEGKGNIISIAWATPLSHNPPLFCVAIHRERYSHRIISNSGVYGVNVMPISLAGAIQYCGDVSGSDVDKFQGAGLTAIPGKALPVPMIDEAIGRFECRVTDVVATGDHDLFVAEVVYVEVLEGRYDRGWIQESCDAALHLLRGRYGRISRS